MVELEDTLDLGSSISDVQVRVLSSAPRLVNLFKLPTYDEIENGVSARSSLVTGLIVLSCWFESNSHQLNDNRKRKEHGKVLGYE